MPLDGSSASRHAIRVLLVLGSLDGGGAERVAVNLANRCDPRLVDITLGLLRPAGAYLTSVDPDRVVAPKSRGRGLADAALAPRDVARMIAKVRPGVVMSFGLGVNLAVHLALTNARPRPLWICREDSNTDAEIDNLTGNRLGRALVRGLTRRLYRSADRLLTVSDELGAKLAGGAPGAPVEVIHNPIDVALISSLAEAALVPPPPRPFIVAAGRLVRQKGFDLLIEAFAGAALARDMDLVILGEGPLAGALKRQAACLGVGDRVRFPGFQANPWAWFSRASLFVLSSRWEGFGNVVAEAMACGVPVLASDCDFGPREQVRHGESGWIADASDPAGFAAAMNTLLADPPLRARLAAAGRRRAGDFDVERVVGPYTRLFLGRGFAHAPATATAPFISLEDTLAAS
jgi:glycosyltransferase involved in cell wall biosynthesis